MEDYKLLGKTRVKKENMEKELFLNTGEFARLCHTTKETLFHYDRKGIFKPKVVSEKGYRRYGIQQYFDFDLITLLKETGSTLEEIRRYREACSPRAYLHLLRERIEVLRKERERFARREAMLAKLVELTEETLNAAYDTLSFEERQAEHVLVFPTISEKMNSNAGVVACYAACLAHDLERGNGTDPPLGMIVPEQNARKGELKVCFFFSRAEAEHMDKARDIPEGRYAVFFHQGDMADQAAAFKRMIEALSLQQLRIVGDVYIYDQMSFFLSAPTGMEYVAKYIVRVEPLS